MSTIALHALDRKNQEPMTWALKKVNWKKDLKFTDSVQPDS